jgi:hypothetical protein
MAWKKVTDSDEEFWQPAQAPEIEGRLIEKQEDFGPNHSMLYVLETERGPINIWGTSVLDKLMAKITVGNDIKIRFLGERTSPKSGRVFKAFEVWENAPDAN